MPTEAKLIFPGAFFASATSSAMLFGAKLALATTISGIWSSVAMPGSAREGERERGDDTKHAFLLLRHDNSAMKTALVAIPTDTVPLDGAWHEPQDGAASNAVLLFHGNTMNFYQGAPRFLPSALARMGYACLAFNRRGHDILGIRDSRDA